MDVGITLESRTTDSIEVELVALERIIATSRARQMELLGEVDRRQVPMSDGCRHLAEWTAARLDVAPETGETLARTALGAPKTVRVALEAGAISYDRAVEVSRLESDDPLPACAGMSIPRVRHHVAHRRRFSRAQERRRHSDRYLVVQPTLDNTALRLHGELVDIDAEAFHRVLGAAADGIPSLPSGEREPRRARLADALASIVIESRPSDGISASATVTVLVDARDAAPTNGEAGVTTLSGLRLGPAALEAILCDAVVEVNALTADGRLLGVGHRTRTLPERLRRAIHQRDRICTVDGCTNTHRLQPHHIRHRVDGGDDDPANLTLLCWFHHHVVIHRRGFRIDPDSAPGRIRFLPHEPSSDPPA